MEERRRRRWNPDRFKCFDCACDTSRSGEYYSVLDTVWSVACAVGPEFGHGRYVVCRLFGTSSRT